MIRGYWSGKRFASANLDRSTGRRVFKLLFDVFISHAGEDKDELVRPLAAALRDARVEVWYDEFALTAGASLRKSIDHGLSKSRFGILVLSPHFFGKGWPEWELSGLLQQYLGTPQSSLIPIWHRVDKSVVQTYSPSLADLVAIPSTVGINGIVEQILRVIQPEESALVVARNMIADRGFEPPVISDDWWLKVIEMTGYQADYRWYFPVWEMSQNSSRRGEGLAWTVMQHIWQDDAEVKAITQMTEPREVLAFIRREPGLLEVCSAMPRRLLEFAPQLAIPGVAGFLEATVESLYQQSLRKGEKRRANGDRGGSGLTINGLCPSCDDFIALRHPTFGDYEPELIACNYVQGTGAGFGPTTMAYPPFDYLAWLLSSKSSWLPEKYHSYLLRGIKGWAMWPWHDSSRESEYSGKDAGALFDWMTSIDAFDITAIPVRASSDLFFRVNHSRQILGLPESTKQLVDQFLAEHVIEAWFLREERRSRHRAKK